MNVFVCVHMCVIIVLDWAPANYGLWNEYGLPPAFVNKVIWDMDNTV